jgi:hypothetical protein
LPPSFGTSFSRKGMKACPSTRKRVRLLFADHQFFAETEQHLADDLAHRGADITAWRA